MKQLPLPSFIANPIFLPTTTAVKFTIRVTIIFLVFVLALSTLTARGQNSSQFANPVQTKDASSDNLSSDLQSTSIVKTPSADQKAEAKMWFLILLGLMIFLYIGQFAFCVRLAKLTRDDDSTRKTDPTIWQSIKKDVESQFGVWAFVIMAFFIPLMLGIVPDIAILSGELLRGSNQAANFNGQELAMSGISARVVYGISITVLTVLITVEFTYLANSPNQRLWQRMLVVALALDIITLIILSYFIFDPKHFPRDLGRVTLFMIGFTGCVAFLSSFLIIVCVRELNALNLLKLKSCAFTQCKKKEV